MAIVNDSQIIGNGTTDIVLNTRGKIYVKVNDRFYELNYKALASGANNTTIINNINPTEDLDLSDYVSKKYLKNTLEDFVTVRNWEDTMKTKEALENAKLEGFTESLTPITVNTMQMTVGNENLQFDFIGDLERGTVVSGGLIIKETGLLRCPKTYIKHYTLDGPEKVKPDTDNKYYARWTIVPEGEEGIEYEDIPLDDNVDYYYVYLRVPTYTGITDEMVDNATEDIKGNKEGNWIISSDSIALDEENGYYHLLTAIITGSGNNRSIGYLNGFTEILPGQIRAYVFSTPDGKQFLDFQREKFKLGNEHNFIDWNVTEKDTLTIKGNISVTGGELSDTLKNFAKKYNEEIELWFSTFAPETQTTPTLQNWPYTEWINKAKEYGNNVDSSINSHLYDLYFDINNGLVYQFLKQKKDYKWIDYSEIYPDKIDELKESLLSAYNPLDYLNKIYKKIKIIKDCVIEDSRLNSIVESITEKLQITQDDKDSISEKKTILSSEINELSLLIDSLLKDSNLDSDIIKENVVKSHNTFNAATTKLLEIIQEYLNWELTDIEHGFVDGSLEEEYEKYAVIVNDFIAKLLILQDAIDSANKNVNANINAVFTKYGQHGSYLEEALKQRTDIAGGLVLTSLIELGFSLNNDTNSEDYYDSFRVMSGINGQMLRNEHGEYDYKDPAIWFGGSMLDREKESDQENPEVISLFVKHNEEYTKYVIGNEQSEQTLYKWIRDNGKSYYTLIESGGAFVNYLTEEQPLKPLEDQPIGTKYSFSRSIKLEVLNTSFIDLSGNSKRLGGSMQTYQIVNRISDTRTAYNISSKTTVTLSGVFDECLVSSHTLPAGGNAVNLVGTNIIIHSDNGTNISGIIFRMDGDDYYFGGSIGQTINTENGIIYTYVSQAWGTFFNAYTYKGSETFTLYKWNHDDQYIYTLTDYDKRPNCLYLLSDSGNVQYTENYKIVDYANNLAKAMFRMDGSGYLADGNVSWNTKGDLTLGQGAISIQTDGTVDLGYLHSDKSSFWIGINENNKMFNISGDTCIINGSLKSKAKSYYEGSFVSVEDSSGTVIADIGSSPLSTAAVPTYLRQTESVSAFYAKGSIMWGVVNIPNNWEYQLIDWYRCFVDGEKYKLNDLNIDYEFCRVSKNITLTIVLRDTDVISNTTKDISLYTKTFGVSKNNQKGLVHEGLLNPSIISGISMKSMHGYSLIMKLSPGQVQSSISSDSWIRIQRGTCEAEITRTSAPIPKGTFIRPNGISSVFGKNSKFQWLGSMSQNYGGYTDYRDRGGTFIVSVPAVSGGDSASSLIGLEITGYMDSSGNGSGDTSTPGIRINLGDGWHKLKIEDKILKIVN